MLFNTIEFLKNSKFMASGRISFQNKYRAAAERDKQRYYDQHRSRSIGDLFVK